MADISKFFPQLLKHEGGFVNDPADRGGATNLGVTLAVWIKNGYDKDGDKDIDVQDLKKITPEDAMSIAKKLYWDKIQGDSIISQSVAEFVFDWAYNSGVGTASRKLQQAIGVKADGEVGPQTIAKLNSLDPEEVFNKLVNSRRSFFEAIVRARPANAKFLKGWRNRLNSFKFND